MLRTEKEIREEINYLRKNIRLDNTQIDNMRAARLETLIWVLSCSDKCKYPDCINIDRCGRLLGCVGV